MKKKTRLEVIGGVRCLLPGQEQYSMAVAKKRRSLSAEGIEVGDPRENHHGSGGRRETEVKLKRKARKEKPGRGRKRKRGKSILMGKGRVIEKGKKEGISDVRRGRDLEM